MNNNPIRYLSKEYLPEYVNVIRMVNIIVDKSSYFKTWTINHFLYKMFIERGYNELGTMLI